MKRLPLWLALSLTGMFALATLGPIEKSLGNHVRIVYLHGAWVWTALIFFGGAGLVGLLGLLLRRDQLHRWSRTLGRTGLIFWIAYLPLSMWASQSNWNGLFLAEPRWRVAVVFAIVGILLQTGLTLLEDPRWTSLFNFLYIGSLAYAINNAQQVMHPPSPILSAESWRFRVFFFALLGLTLLSSAIAARWLHRLER